MFLNFLYGLKKKSRQMKQDWRIFFFKTMKYPNIFLKNNIVENNTIYTYICIIYNQDFHFVSLNNNFTG